MTAAADLAGLLVAAGGLLLSILTAARHGLQPAVPVLLDFLLAAGLLRLAAAPEWDRILTTAVIAALRHLITAGLRPGRQLQAPRRSTAPPPPGHGA